MAISASEWLQWAVAFGVYPPDTAQGSVTSVGTGTGLTGGPITTTGDISFAPIAGNSFWANVTGSSAVPTVQPLSSFTPSALTNAYIYVGNASNVATGVAVSGDATLANTGALTVSKIGGKAVTLAGTFTTSGAYAATLTLTGITNSTLPVGTTTLVPTTGTGATGVWSGLTGLGTQAQALNMNSHQINGVSAPTAAGDAANKQYVDNIAAGLNPIEGVYAASTANLTSWTYNNGVSGVGATLTAPGNGVFTVDGVSPAVGARFLYKDDSDGLGAYNGIYTVTTSTSGSPAVLTRATDYNTPSDIQPGDLIAVQTGTVNANSSWLQTATIVTVGVTPLVFSVFFLPSNFVTPIQVQRSAFNVGIDSGIADAYVVTLSPAVTSYTDGLQVIFNPLNANTVTNPTVAVNGLAATTIVGYNGAALVAGDLAPGYDAICVYSGTNSTFQLTNPQVVGGAGPWSAGAGTSSAQGGDGTADAAGNYSLAYGSTGVAARGLNSVAFGDNVTAGGDFSFCMGSNTSDSASAHSFTFGQDCGGYSSSDFSFSFGLSSGAFGHYAVAWGNGCSTAGDYGFAFGNTAAVAHAGSVVWGDSNASPNADTAANQFNLTFANGFNFYEGATNVFGINSSGAVSILATATDNTLLYATGGVITALATANYGTLRTSSSGVPSIITKPAFYAYPSVGQSNVTGDGTVYKVLFDSVLMNIGNGYNTTTNLFTASVTGLHVFSVALFLNGLTSSFNAYNLYLQQAGSSANFYTFVYSNLSSQIISGDIALSGSCSVYLTAGDTIGVYLQISGSSKTVNLNSGTPASTYVLFSGGLI